MSQNLSMQNKHEFETLLHQANIVNNRRKITIIEPLADSLEEKVGHTWFPLERKSLRAGGVQGHAE